MTSNHYECHITFNPEDVKEVQSIMQNFNFHKYPKLSNWKIQKFSNYKTQKRVLTKIREESLLTFKMTEMFNIAEALYQYSVAARSFASLVERLKIETPLNNSRVYYYEGHYKFDKNIDPTIFTENIGLLLSQNDMNQRWWGSIRSFNLDRLLEKHKVVRSIYNSFIDEQEIESVIVDTNLGIDESWGGANFN